MGRVTLLIGRFKCGSQTAFASLMGWLLPHRIRAARRALRGDPAGILDPEDVAQRTFWELWRSMSRGGPLAVNLSDTASLLKVLAVLTRQQINRGRRDANRQLRDARRTVQAMAESATDPWSAVFGASESKEVVEKLVELLPRDRQKAVVRLHLQGLSSAEAARHLNCSVRTVVRSYETALVFCRTSPEARAALAAWDPAGS